MRSSPTGPAPSNPGVHPSANGWTAVGGRFRDPRSGISAEIDLDAPLEGVRLGNETGRPGDHLLGLGVLPPWRLADHWVRGVDVTAVYESNDSRQLRASAMWRLHHCSGGARGWQAIVSAQTSLLHSDSLLAVTSTLAGGQHGDVLWGRAVQGAVQWQRTEPADPSCVLVRRDDGVASDAASVLIAGHPGEFSRFEFRRVNGVLTIACWLFPTPLEKGVLLRSRVLAAIGPRHEDESWATAAATAFAMLPPMLTT